MVLLTTVGSVFEARLLAARLGSEGVIWELRGADALYPVGPIHVLVAESDADTARAVALAQPDVGGLGTPADARTASGGWAPSAAPIDLRTPLGLWLVLAAILAVAAVGLIRAVTMQPVPVAPPPSAPASASAG
jgi:hypothetical protein